MVLTPQTVYFKHHYEMETTITNLNLTEHIKVQAHKTGD